MKVKEGGFEFRISKNETSVYRGKRLLGTIVGMKESSGRHCFRLGADKRRKPRTYRGRVKSAEALLAIDTLCRNAKKHKWSPEVLVIRAWEARVASVTIN